MKKSISFVLAAFLILLGVAKTNVVSAQLGATDKSYVHDGSGWIGVPVSGDGQEQVWVYTEFRCVCHWIDGQMQWMHMWYHFSITYKGEIFEVYEKQDYGKFGAGDMNDPAFYNVRFVCHAKGSNGTKLIASGTFDWWYTGEFTFDKFIFE